MEKEEKKIEEQEIVQPTVELKPKKMGSATHVVTADSVQAEEIPTIPIGSLDSIHALQPEVSVHSVAAMKSIGLPAPLVVQPSEYRRSINEWLQIWRDGIRTPLLALPLMPLFLGSLLAWLFSLTPKNPLGQFHPTHFLGALVTVILLQLGANLVNDYYDYQRGVDTTNALGPGGLIQQGLVKPTRVLISGLTLLGLGAISGLVVSISAGPLLCLFGLITVLCAYFYSASRFPLASFGLSELIAFVVFGPLTTLGAYMLQTRNLDQAPLVLLYSLPLGLLAAALILVNNMRDIEGDQHVNKRTLPVLIGLGWCRSLYIALLAFAYIVILALGIPSHAPHWILIAFWTLPTAVVAMTGAARASVTANYHQLLQQTLKLLTTFTILLLIGLIIAYIIPVAPQLPTKLLPF